MCSRQAATGSGSSSRTVARIASQSRATSGSPKACSAQPGVGKATIVHGISPRSKACQYAWRSSGITERADAARVEAVEEVRVGLADDVHERCAGARPPP